jgi:hypothetical protein
MSAHGGTSPRVHVRVMGCQRPLASRCAAHHGNFVGAQASIKRPQDVGSSAPAGLHNQTRLTQLIDAHHQNEAMTHNRYNVKSCCSAALRWLETPGGFPAGGGGLKGNPTASNRHTPIRGPRGLVRCRLTEKGTPRL